MGEAILPNPLVPLEADLRDFKFMPLEVGRLRDSELASAPDAEVFRANVLSWCVAWHQVPAGSLPDDDGTLARLLGYGRDLKTWAKVRTAGGLRNWFKAKDGRLYHPLVAEKVLEAWIEKLFQRKASGAGNAKRWGADFDPANIENAIGNASRILAGLNPQSRTLEKLSRKHPAGNPTGMPPAQDRDANRESQNPGNGSQETGTGKKEKTNPNGLAKKAAERKTSIAPDWKPDERDREFCLQSGWGERRIEQEAAKFRDRNIALDGKYVDWGAAWRNWCRNADKFAAVSQRASGGRGRATEGERRSAIYASVAGELGDRGDAASEHGRPGNGVAGDRCDVGPGGPESLRSLAGPALCEPPYATEGIADDVAGTSSPVSAGCSEAGLGSRLENPQMGNPTEDRADGRGSGSGPVLSAPSASQSHVAESHHAAGMGRAGPDEDFFDLPQFLRRQQA